MTGEIGVSKNMFLLTLYRRDSLKSNMACSPFVMRFIHETDLKFLLYKLETYVGRGPENCADMIPSLDTSTKVGVPEARVWGVTGISGARALSPYCSP